MVVVDLPASKKLLKGSNNLQISFHFTLNFQLEKFLGQKVLLTFREVDKIVPSPKTKPFCCAQPSPQRHLRAHSRCKAVKKKNHKHFEGADMLCFEGVDKELRATLTLL